MYGTRTPTPTSKRRFTYAALAKALVLTPDQVRHYCTSALKKSPKIKVSFDHRLRLKSKDLSRKLEEHHVDFLLDPDTLEEWAGKTYLERVALFRKKYPSKQISATFLWRLYK